MEGGPGMGSGGVTVTKILQLLMILELYLELSYSAGFAGDSGSNTKYFGRFQKLFLEGCHLRHCRGVNLNSYIFLKTLAVSLVLTKLEVLLYFLSQIYIVVTACN